MYIYDSMFSYNDCVSGDDITEGVLQSLYAYLLLHEYLTWNILFYPLFYLSVCEIYQLFQGLDEFGTLFLATTPFGLWRLSSFHPWSRVQWIEAFFS